MLTMTGPVSQSIPRPGTRRVLICDLDGTVIDSVPDLAAALGAYLSGLGRRRPAVAEVRTMVGDGVPKLLERAFAATGGQPPANEFPDHVARYLAVYEGMMVERTRPYPGAVEVLSALKAEGWRLAVCTNKPEAPSHGILAALDLGHLFEAVAGGDTFPVRKPDAGHLLGLLARLGESAEAGVMLGDGPADVGAARAAGMPVIAVANGYGPVPAAELGADLVIAHFAELPRALSALADGASGAGRADARSA
jgi:phosphoglycolate phosphatase